MRRRSPVNRRAVLLTRRRMPPSPVSPSLRRLPPLGGVGSEGRVIDWITSRNRLSSAPPRVRGWFPCPPAGASPAAGLSRVCVASVQPRRDAMLGLRAHLRERLFLRRLG